MSDYLVIEDVMKLFKMSENKTRALFKTEGFPTVRIGQTYYVRADSLDEWMKQQEGKCIRVDFSKV